MATELGLGRLPATDDVHLQRYSLTAETMPTTPTPVVLGVNWYAGFDRPLKDERGVSWLPATGWGTIRGGHAICVKPPQLFDTDGWYVHYNQGREGACVGFATSRMMSLLNRRRYDGLSLYRHAQRIDEWPGEAYSGTSVRAGMDVVRDHGSYRTYRGVVSGPHPRDGIQENRWARSVEEIAACLSPEDSGARILTAGYVTFLNSWGSVYPQYTRMRLETLRQLVFQENGDATVVVDRTSP